MNISPGIFLLILALPIVDLFLLILTGNYLGAVLTIVLVVFTSVLGFLVLQRVGTHGWSRMQQNLGQGDVPSQILVERFILMLAGIMLLIPGFITDIIGLIVLLPVVRAPLARRIMKVMLGTHPGAGLHPGQPADPGAERPRDQRTIEGEYKREE